jgi:hypothetical protein
VVLSSMHHALPWLSRTALAMTCTSTVVSAGMSLYLLRRVSPDGYLRYLGLALGWWSLGFGYLWLFSVVRSAGVHPAGMMWRIVLDAAAFQLLLAASIATLAFVASFPRRVPQEELMRFLTALWRRQSSFLGLVHGAATAPAGDRAIPEMPLRKRLQLPLWVISGVVLGLSLFWRPSSLSPGPGTASLLMLLAFMAFCALVARPALSALRHLKFHRLTGSPEDRRRIARLQTSLSTGALLVLLFAAVMVCLSLTGMFPGLRPGVAVGRVLELSVFAGQLAVLLALLFAVLRRPRQEAAP